jgi:hypothetical protein
MGVMAAVAVAGMAVDVGRTAGEVPFGRHPDRKTIKNNQNRVLLRSISTF